MSGVDNLCCWRLMQCAHLMPSVEALKEEIKTVIQQQKNNDMVKTTMHFAVAHCYPKRVFPRRDTENIRKAYLQLIDEPKRL